MKRLSSVIVLSLLLVFLVGEGWCPPALPRTSFEDAGGVVAYPYKVIHDCTQTVNADGTTTLVCVGAARFPIAAAGGTADAITANYTPDVTLTDKTIVAVVALGANTITTPTFAPDGLTARTIVKQGGVALVVGDIPRALYVCLLEYNLANTRWELLNPAFVQTTITGNAGTATALAADPAGCAGGQVTTDINATGVSSCTAWSANVLSFLGSAPFAVMQWFLSVDDLVTLSGVADGSVNLGTFTGSTISDNVTIKAAIQAVETAVETKQASDTELTSIAGLTFADKSIIQLTGAGTSEVLTCTAANQLIGVNAANDALECKDGIAIQTIKDSVKWVGQTDATKTVTFDLETNLDAGDDVIIKIPDYGADVTFTLPGIEYANTWTGQQTFVAPILGAATATSLLAAGMVDGVAPVTITATSAGFTLGSTYKSGYTFTNPVAAAAAFIMTLPTAAAGLQYCVGNGAAKTGTLTINSSAGGQYIDLDGVLTASGGHIQSAGAAGDFACFIGVDATHWKSLPTKGTWTAD